MAQITETQKLATIVAEIAEKGSSTVKFNNSQYSIKHDEFAEAEIRYYNEMQHIDENVLRLSATPFDQKYHSDHDTAVSMSYDDYRYTHGGATYRLAVELINDLEEFIKSE